MAAITPALVLARIASIEREILNPVSGNACKAFDNVPYVVNTMDMPLFINYIGPLTQNLWMGSDGKGREFNEIRTFNLVMYLAPYGAGIEGEKMGLLTPYFDLVYTKFGSYPHLKGLAGAVDATLINDGGVGTVQFAEMAYYGIRFTLQVTSRVRRELHSIE